MSTENANVSNVTPAAPVVKVYTNANIQTYEQRLKELFPLRKNAESEEELEKIDAERFTLKGKIEAEIKGLKDAEKAAEAEATKAEKIAFRINFATALLAANVKGAPQEAKDALTAATVALDDQLLSTVKRVSTPTASGNGVPAKGSKSAEILALYQGYRNEGKTNGEAVKLIVTAGYNDGTVNAVSKAERIRTGEWKQA